MDPGEAVVLVIMVIFTLIFISGVMVRIRGFLLCRSITFASRSAPDRCARSPLSNPNASASVDLLTCLRNQIGVALFMGARFDSLWKTDSVYWPGDPRNPSNPSYTKPAAATTGVAHGEL